MEYNKDESVRCLQIAHDCLARGDKEKATKFAKKSEQLYPSAQAKDLLEKINRLGGLPSREANKSKESLRKRTEHTHKENKHKYSEDQINAVKRIKRCKDYYEILGIDKDATDNEIKKRYRKLALQFHPDKNHAPGAIEAFKAIGNAFSILSDAEKRRKYDLMGASAHNNSASYHHNHRQGWNYSHGFESDMTAEEIFNMFFGGGGEFAGNEHRAANGGTAHTFRRHHHVNRENWSQLLLQLSPIVVLIILSITSMALVDDHPYSFVQTPKYADRRVSENLQVVYFVMKTFSERYAKNSIKQLEKDVESAYVRNLQQECLKETNKQENLKWKARQYNNKKLDEEANSLEMEHCNRLEEMYTR